MIINHYNEGVVCVCLLLSAEVRGDVADGGVQR